MIPSEPAVSVPLLVIVGPTAVGKSALGVRLAAALDAEVISADSMQVYRGFDIGTGKATADERATVRHHLIDVVDPEDRFSAARFVELADDVICDLASRGRRAIVIGGTGLYVRALLHGLMPTPLPTDEIRRRLEAEAAEHGVELLYRRLEALDPLSAAQVAPTDLRRICRALEVHQQTGRPISELRAEHAFSPWRYPALLLGLRLDPARLRERIEARVDRMIAAGWLDEVRELCQAGYEESHAMGALGYRQLAAHLRGELDRDAAVRLTKRDTWRFARRQRNWFSAEDGLTWRDEPFASIDSEPLGRRLDELGRTWSGRPRPNAAEAE